jgi:hypothetical protein
MQLALDFTQPKLTPQSQRLYEALRQSPLTNAEMRDKLRLLSYTRRLSDLREAGIRITKQYLRDGLFLYSIKGE